MIFTKTHKMNSYNIPIMSSNKFQYVIPAEKTSYMHLTSYNIIIPSLAWRLTTNNTCPNHNLKHLNGLLTQDNITKWASRMGLI